jgi:hypothetical protein
MGKEILHLDLASRKKERARVQKRENTGKETLHLDLASRKVAKERGAHKREEACEDRRSFVGQAPLLGLLSFSLSICVSSC